MGRSKVYRPGGAGDRRLGRPLTCRFTRDVEFTLESLAVAQGGITAQDIVRSLVMEALAVRASGGDPLQAALTASFEAGRAKGYADGHNRWRKALGALFNEQPPEEP